MPTFEYEPLVLSLEPKTWDEEEDKRYNDGVGPLRIRTIEEELGDLRGGRDSPKREVGDKTYVSEQTLEPLEYVVQDVSFQEYAFATT
jgi:hypothetical protein